MVVVPVTCALPCIERREPGEVVPTPKLPVELAMVRNVEVEVLVLLMIPHARFPLVVEANQWVFLVTSFDEKSVRMNCGVVVAITESVAKGDDVPTPKRAEGPALYIERRSAESRVVAPE